MAVLGSEASSFSSLPRLILLDSADQVNHFAIVGLRTRPLVGDWGSLFLAHVQQEVLGLLWLSLFLQTTWGLM